MSDPVSETNVQQCVVKCLSIDELIAIARKTANDPEAKAAMIERIKQRESEFKAFDKATKPDWEFMNRPYGI